MAVDLDILTVTVTLTGREAVALQRAAAFFASSFEAAGIDLTEVELPNGRIGVSPLLAGVGLLEIELLAAGVQ